MNLTQATLRVGVHDRLVSVQDQDRPSTRALHAGFRVVAAAPQGDVKADDLWVRDGRLLVGRREDAMQQPNAFDYFLFSLERLARREDWSTLQPLGGRIKALNDQLAASSLSEDRIREEFELFKSGVVSCPDLIHTDRVAIVRGIRARVQEALELRREGLDEGGFLGQVPDLASRHSPLGDLRQVGHDLALAELAACSVRDLLNITL